MTRRQQIVDTIRDGVKRVEDTFGGLSGQELETPVEIDGQEWPARDVLAYLAGRSYEYEFIMQAVGFEGMPDMGEFGPGHYERAEATNRMVRDSFNHGSSLLDRRPGTFNPQDEEWKYRALAPFAGKEADEILAEFRRVHEDLIDRIETMPEDLLNKPAQFDGAGDTLGDLLQQRAGHALNEYAGKVQEAVVRRTG